MTKHSLETLQRACFYVAKAANTSMRLYQGTEYLYSYSVYHLDPDPVELYLPQLLAPERTAGVFTTPVGQHYGYLTIDGTFRLIFGPTRIPRGQSPQLREYLFRLGVKEEQRESYVHTLHCMLPIGLERMGWLVRCVFSLLNQCELPPEEFQIDVNYSEEIPSIGGASSQEEAENIDTKDLLKRGYHYGQLLCSYVEQGKVERLRELFSAPPNHALGHLSDDAIRQRKDTAICSAAMACQSAIAGGMSSPAAFEMSDAYIQKIELMQDAVALRQLNADIFIGFAREVAQIQARSTFGGKQMSGILSACVDYVAQNIYDPIRVQDMAEALGYTRSYLSSYFKHETGITLTQYILSEKIWEAQRMLRFTDRSLTEIAQQFSFSSQSHFQNVFKKVTGRTPVQYRNNPETGN